MPWIEAMLRGQKVLAKAREDGSLVSEGGRVEIRYKPKDGKAYRAAAGNLEVVAGAKVLPEETCGEAGPVEAKKGVGVGVGGGVGAGAGGSVGAGAGGSGSAGGKVAGSRAWQAFTDGACSGNPGPAGSGIVLIEPGGKIREGLEYLGEATNNVAELTAILRALEWLPAEVHAPVVHTDSQYAIGVLSKGWKPKVNQALIAKTRALVVERAAKLVYVPGHAGVPMNERADQLAREAIATRRSRRAEG